MHSSLSGGNLQAKYFSVMRLCRCGANMNSNGALSQEWLLCDLTHVSTCHLRTIWITP